MDCGCADAPQNRKLLSLDREINKLWDKSTSSVNSFLGNRIYLVFVKKVASFTGRLRFKICSTQLQELTKPCLKTLGFDSLTFFGNPHIETDMGDLKVFHDITDIIEASGASIGDDFTVKISEDPESKSLASSYIHPVPLLAVKEPRSKSYQYKFYWGVDYSTFINVANGSTLTFIGTEEDKLVGEFIDSNSFNTCRTDKFALMEASEILASSVGVHYYFNPNFNCSSGQTFSINVE